VPVFTIDGPSVQYGGLGIVPDECVPRPRGLGALDRQNVGTLTVQFGDPGRYVVALPPWVRRYKRYRFDGLGAVTDYICTASDCDSGAVAVRQLQRFYDEVSRPPQFAAAVAAIVDTFNEAVPWFKSFNPTCCAIAELGRRADQLVTQIGQATGQVAPPEGEKKSGFPWWLVWTAAGVGLAVWAGPKLITAVKTRRALHGARRRR